MTDTVEVRFDLGSTQRFYGSSWIRACVVGELIGFVPPAVVGAVLFSVDAPEIVLIVGLVVAGIGEGIVLGQVQSSVIRSLFPGVSGWTHATATAAGVAWLAGMGGSALVQAAGPDVLVIVVPGWIVGLLSMGLLQANRLASVVDNAYDWVGATTIGWLAGVSIPVIALSVVPNEWPLPVHVVSAVVAAVAMGATVGVVSAPTLHRLANSAPRATTGGN